MTLKEKIALWLAEREIRKRAVEWLEQLLGRPLTRKEKTMFLSFITNWKTSLIGVVMAAVQLHQGGMGWRNALVAALFASLGLVAKDSNVTGGTVKQ